MPPAPYSRSWTLLGTGPVALVLGLTLAAGRVAMAGVPVIAGWFLIALPARTTRAFRPFAFTGSIFAGVAAALLHGIAFQQGEGRQ